jgi:hypothetical protein
MIYFKKDHQVEEWAKLEQYFGNQSQKNQQNLNTNYSSLRDDDSEMHLNETSTKPYEEEYNEALEKKRNWKEQDYRNNGETREGLEKWIRELEIKRSINEWDFNW